MFPKSMPSGFASASEMLRFPAENQPKVGMCRQSPVLAAAPASTHSAASRRCQHLPSVDPRLTSSRSRASSSLPSSTVANVRPSSSSILNLCSLAMNSAGASKNFTISGLIRSSARNDRSYWFLPAATAARPLVPGSQ